MVPDVSLIRLLGGGLDLVVIGAGATSTLKGGPHRDEKYAIGLGSAASVPSPGGIVVEIYRPITDGPKAAVRGFR
jgi:hypothetical protein